MKVNIWSGSSLSAFWAIHSGLSVASNERPYIADGPAPSEHVEGSRFNAPDQDGPTISSTAQPSAVGLLCLSPYRRAINTKSGALMSGWLQPNAGSGQDEKEGGARQVDGALWLAPNLHLVDRSRDCGYDGGLVSFVSNLFLEYVHASSIDRSVLCVRLGVKAGRRTSRISL